ncbi:MAG: murein biosynthesis integral membrane protein MurJ [Pseudomonadota bacterium]
MKPIRLVSGFLTVGVWTLLSRVLGFVRDATIVALLGTGPLYEAYVVAFRLPNMFRRFFAEGAFNTAFVPMFSKKVEAQDGAHEFAQDAFSGLASILIVLTLLAQLFMPWLIYAIASGFAGQEKFDIAVDFARIAFPYILFISLAALLSGVLNATGRFAAAAAAPVLLNILFISAVAIAVLVDGSVADWLIWAIPIAGVAQLALVWVAASRAGFRLTFRWPRMTADLKRLAVIAAPAALAGGVVQINLVVGQQVASYYDRAVSWLYNADRLYQLPLGVVGIAIGIVLLPDLSRRLRAGDANGGQQALTRAGELALALTIPAAVALMIVPIPLVSVLFERGLVTAQDTAATAAAVAIYGLGLPSFVLQKVLQPLYFAREDTKTPFYFALVGMIVNAALAVGLAYSIGWLASAIAATVAGWVMVLLLLIGARKLGPEARFAPGFGTRIFKITLASIGMGAVLWVAALLMTPGLNTAGIRYIALLALVSIGMASYAMFGQLIGAFRLSELRAALRR